MDCGAAHRPPCAGPPPPTHLGIHAAGADPDAAALLLECRGQTADALEARIREIQGALRRAALPFGAKATEPMDVTVGCRGGCLGGRHAFAVHLATHGRTDSALIPLTARGASTM